MKYKCKLCGYIYDPEVGELRSKKEEATVFGNLFKSWRCPSCGTAKTVQEDLNYF